MSTESALREWRFGSTMAERLAASLLAIDGYSDITPQAPLGGPDGRKDIMAVRDGLLHVGAVHFPPTPQHFASISNKFVHDRRGLAGNMGDRFIFFVNQDLTLPNKASLKGAGAETDEIYDLQRIVSILDSPPGYGVRLSYLRIQMTTEEQVSFFSTLQEQIVRRANERHDDSAYLREMMGRTLDRLDQVYKLVASSIDHDVLGDVVCPAGDLSVASLLLIHSAVTDGSPMPSEVRGVFRSVPVWIADGLGGKLDGPSAPEQIVPELKRTLTWWREEYKVLAANPVQSSVVSALATLHWELAKTHPFVDGNGRMIRFVLNQASEELLRRRIDRRLTQDREAYYGALSAARNGDLGQLRLLISAALL